MSTINITTPAPTNVAVTGTDSVIVTTNALGAFPGYHGLFISTQTQLSAGANQINTVTFNTTVEADGFIAYSGNRIRNTYAGTYLYTLSVVVSKTDGGNDDIDIWFGKNGSSIANSNTRATIDKANGHDLVTITFLQTMAANSDLYVYWSSADADMRLLNSGPFTTPTRPAIPSIILTATQVQ